MICHKCGTQLEEGARFCMECGTPQNILVPEPVPEPVSTPEPVPAPVPVPDYPTEGVCPFCISPLRKGTKFCNTCGRPVVPVQTPVTQAPEKQKKGKGLVIGLCITLVVALLAVGGFFLWNALNPSDTPDEQLGVYEEAVALYEDGEYEDAIELFEELGDYENSKSYLKKARKRLEKEDPTEETTEETEPTTQATTEETRGPVLETQAPTTQPPMPVETMPTEPAETVGPTEGPVELVQLQVKEAELEYALTDADVEEFYMLLEQSEAMAMAGEDLDAVEQITDQLDEKYGYLEEQYTIAMVLYYCDLNDEAASQLYLDCMEIVTQANNDYLEMARRIYTSESPAKEMLFADWTQEELDDLMAYTSEVMELQQRLSELEVEYQEMQDDEDMYDKMVPIYLETVRLNTRIAEIYGFDNYYAYAYDRVYDRDYETSRIAQVREYAAEYLVPAMDGAMKRFVGAMDSLGTQDAMELYALLFEPYYDSTTPYVESYLTILPETMRADMVGMFNGDILMLDDVDGAMEGAFTTNIGDDRVICFYGPGYSNAETIIHEVGHYYGATHTYLNDIPLDLAEVHSQGNEWLFITHCGTQMDSELYQAVLDYRMYSDMTTVLVSLIVDEFEEQVYTHPDIANLTGEDLEVIMQGVCERYGGLDYLAENVTDMQSYWRYVVVEQPVYYVSYAVSALASMDLFMAAQEDFDGALESYRILGEEMETDLGFLGNLEKAGLSGPFEVELYAKILEMFG